jgi:hypothetical protein
VNITIAERIRGKVIYLLGIILLLHLTYPFSEMGIIQAILYLLVYCSLLGFGVYFIFSTRLRFILMPVLVLTTVIIGGVWIADPANIVLSIVTFSLLTVFLIAITITLFEFVFQAAKITRDVLLAAIAVYLLIGNIFTTSYTVLDIVTRATMNQGAFIIGGDPSVPVTWQKLFYYSYTTLTTMGYGDILPATSMAQSVATLEAILGVLYVAILVGRLVGVYSAGE